MCCTLLKKKQHTEKETITTTPTTTTTTSTLSSVLVPNEFTEKETALVDQPEASQQKVVEQEESEQAAVNYLLDPIGKEQQGRKCLVLDLDETLIHSSFKVISIHSEKHTANDAMFRLYLRQTLLFLSKSMAIVIMYLY
jgi:TFIIF-interacting CTD phosphatase-like protein